MEARIEDLKHFVEDGVQNLSKLLRENAPLAKQELHSHLLGVQMYPSEDGEGWCYIAEGMWDLLGNAPLAPKSWVPEVGRFEMVAGACNHPNVPSIHFRFTLQPNHIREHKMAPIGVVLVSSIVLGTTDVIKLAEFTCYSDRFVHAIAVKVQRM